MYFPLELKITLKFYCIFKWGPSNLFKFFKNYCLIQKPREKPFLFFEKESTTKFNKNVGSKVP